MSGMKWGAAGVAFAVCSFGVGFWLGGSGQQDRPRAQEQNAAAVQPVRSENNDKQVTSSPLTFDAIDSHSSTVELYSQVGKLSQSAIDKILEEATNMAEDARSQSFAITIGVLVERLTILNPQAVIDRAADLPGEEYQRKAWKNSAAIQLVRDNPDTARTLLTTTDSQRQIIGELAKQNPAAAAEMANEHGLLAQLGNAIGKSWGTTDPEGAIAYMKGLEPENRLNFFKGMVAGWAKVDPSSMLDQVAAGFLGENDLVEDVARKEVTAAVFGALTGEFFHRGGGGFMIMTDSADNESTTLRPDLAAEWLNTLTVGEDYESRDARNIAAAWAKEDIDKALSWANAFEEKRTRDEGLTGIVTTVAQTDPVRAAQIFDEAPDDWFKVNEVQPVLTALIRKDAVAAAQWWEKLPLNERVFHLDPQMSPEGYPKITEFLGAMSEPENQLQAFIATGRQWGSVDPVNAVGWAKGIEDPSMQTTVLKQVLSEFANIAPQGAAEVATELADSSLRAEVFATAGKNWARSDPDSALTWAIELTGADSVHAIDSLIPELAQSDPAGLAALLESDDHPVTSLVNLPEASEAIARNWSESDPVAAVDWATRQTGYAKERALAAIAETIGAAQPDTAIEMLAHISPGPTRDGAIEKLARPMLRFAPSSAIKLAETVTDETMRTELISESYRRWLVLDRNSAMGSRQSDAFSEDSQTIFNQTINQLP